MNHETKFIYLFIYLFTQCINNLQAQTFLSEEWTKDGIASPIYNRTVVKTDPLGNVYKAGSTLNGTNVDMIVQKYSAAGILLWENIYNGVASLGDRAVDMYIDNSYNVYVVGAVGKSVNVNIEVHDICVVKYSSSGAQQWMYFYDGNGNDDIGTSITSDGSFLYITGGSTLTTNHLDYDFVIIKLSMAGVAQWTVRDDYGAGTNQLQFPGQIVVRAGMYYVTGYAQNGSSPFVGNIVQLKGQASTGAVMQYSLVGANSFTGVNAFRDFAIDNNYNLYIAGADQLTNTGMIVWKLNSSLQTVLTLSLNPYGTTAIAKSVKVDNAGNIYVVGHANHPTEMNNFILLKYNAAGVLQWQREYNGDANGNDNGEQVALLGNNYVVVTGSSDKSGEGVGVRTLLYNTNGELLNEIWHKYTPGSVDVPVGMTVDDQKNVVISATSTLGATTYNLVFKYKLYERASEIVLDTAGAPTHVAGEVIVRFNSNYVERTVVDRKGKQAGLLNEFIAPAAIAAINAKLGFDVSRLETYKVFRRMTTADSISYTRNGDSVKIDDYWATFVVNFPKHYNEKIISDSLSKISSFVNYAELNNVGQFFSIPNDVRYISGSQRWIKNFSSTPGYQGSISVEKAWERNVGSYSVKVGVFDTGINWAHEDFGDGTYNGSKIKGHDFINGVSPGSQLQHDYNGHGTIIGGIIGALRNNGKGIAGIAGGDVLNGNTGCSIYSMRLGTALSADSIYVNFVTYVLASEAILEGALSTNSNYGFGLDIQNHSWGGKYKSILLRQAALEAFNVGSVIVASSGNDGDQYNTNLLYYPSSYTDNWVCKVGASSDSGQRTILSNYSSSVDFLAPGEENLYIGMQHDNNSGYNNYQSGTSFSVPHVVGVAALMYSQHNPINNSEYPEVLYPEDIQNILKKTAREVKDDGFLGLANAAVPNNFAGHGVINADSALALVSLPYRVRHFFSYTSVPSSYVLHAANQTMLLVQGAPWWLSPGNQILKSDIYKVTVEDIYTLPSNESFVDAWAINSNTPTKPTRFLYDLTNEIYDKHVGGSKLIFADSSKVRIEGYTYRHHLYDVNNNFIGYEWEPIDPTQACEIRYSVLTKDKNPNVSVNESSNVSVNLFPNPTTEMITIKINNFNESVILQIYDVSGKLMGLSKMTNNEKVVDLSAYASGVYFFRFTLNNEVLVKKIIKN